MNTQNYYLFLRFQTISKNILIKTQSFVLVLIFMLLSCNMNKDQIINPFGYGIATKVIDENKKPADWWMQYLEFNQAVEENEFYVLFADGMLVKKGRSKYKSSQYTFGDAYKSFQQYYDEKKTLKYDTNDGWYFIAHGIIDENLPIK
jgi:hypothetical protein